MGRFKFSDSKYEEMCILYKNGKSSTEIGKILSISHGCVLKTLKRYGIERRSIIESTRRYSADDNYFEKINNKEKAYFLGLMCADGSNSGFTNEFYLSLHKKDRKIVDKFKEELKYTGVCYYSNRQIVLNISSKKLSEDLSKWGIIPKKASRTYFPNIEEKFWSHFIRGYFDGDGGIWINAKGYLNLSFSGNFDLIQRIQEILIEKCGINKTKLSKSAISKSNIHTLFSSGINKCKSIGDYIYQDCEEFYIDRKKELFPI